MENRLFVFYVITAHGCFSLRAENGEAACEVFKTGIRLQRSLKKEPLGPMRQAIVETLAAVFTSPNGRQFMPLAVLEDDLRNELLLAVLDERKTRVICTYQAGKMMPFISREAFSRLGKWLPGKDYGGVYDYVKSQLDEQDNLLRNLDGLLGKHEPGESLQ